MRFTLWKHKLFATAILLMIMSLGALCGTAHAVCPLCVIGAGYGVAKAVAEVDARAIYIWYGALCLSAAYVLAASYFRRRIYLAEAMLFSYLLAALLLPAMLGGVWLGSDAADARAFLSAMTQPKNLGHFSEGAAATCAAAFCACVIKQYIRIPFLKPMLIITAVWLIAG